MGDDGKSDLVYTEWLSMDKLYETGLKSTYDDAISAVDNFFDQ